MSESVALPVCCWPFRSEAAGARLYVTRFDTRHFQDSAFAHHGMILPVTLARAVTKRRAEYLAGRLCARHALSSLNIAVSDLPGLPDRQVDWPAGSCGSITHARTLAGAMVSTRDQHQGLGIDAELWLTPERADYLAESILTEAEQQRLAGLTDVQRARAITLTFSLKESLFKALYPLTGTRFYFHDASIERLMPEPDTGQCRLVLHCDLDTHWRAGTKVAGEYTDYDGHALTAVRIRASA